MNKANLKPVLIWLLVFSFFFPGGFLFAEQDKNKSSAWTIGDVLNLERASDFQISPDGTRVVWVKNLPDPEKDRRISHLFLSYLDQNCQIIQLTRGESSEFHPRWSPGGNFIAFLSNRKDSTEAPGDEDSKGNQLWLLNLKGGEPWKITNLEFGVLDFDWIDDHRFLILAREPKTLHELKDKEKKDDSIIY
ncbi:MAG: TolB family protein, partial [Candidatus Saccharicenans sp.]